MIYESLHRKYEHSVPDYTKIVTRFQDFPFYKKNIWNSSVLWCEAFVDMARVQFLKVFKM